MKKEYEELSRRATKGDKEALRELFAFAEQLENQGEYQEAALAFRDSAIAYRISAFRNSVRAEEAESHSALMTNFRDIYRKWINENSNELPEVPYQSTGVTPERIREVLYRQLLKEGLFIENFVLLGGALSSLGMEFSSPGHSFGRHVCILLEQLFGLREIRNPRYLNDIDVRIGLGAIADEVRRRCQSLK